MIDVGTSEGLKLPRLLETAGLKTADKRHRYVALSHCWGIAGENTFNKHMKATKANVKRLKRGIDVSYLPATFRDAIAVVRSLGVRYLWIDSLCIIQDDDQDWHTEARQMGSIYERAYFTIAATSAQGDLDGFLHQRLDGNTSRIRCSLDDEKKGYAYLTDQPTSNPRLKIEQARLNTRGWVLQERLLSRRIVHFAEDQVYWKCRECLLGEDNIPHGSSRLDEKSLAGIARTLSALQQTKGLHTSSSSSGWEADEHHHEFMDLWLRIVAKYSTCNFTKSTDRAPALLGLADRLGSLVDDLEYENGEWFGNPVSRSLLWEASAYSDNGCGSQKTLGPSWSWIAHARPVTFPYVGLGKPSIQLCNKSSLAEDGFIRLGITGRTLPVDLQATDNAGRTRSIYNANAFETMKHRMFTDTAIGTVTFDNPTDAPRSMHCLLLTLTTRNSLVVLALEKKGEDPSGTVYRRLGIGSIKDSAAMACFGAETTMTLA